MIERLGGVVTDLRATIIGSVPVVLARITRRTRAVAVAGTRSACSWRCWAVTIPASGWLDGVGQQRAARHARHR